MRQLFQDQEMRPGLYDFEWNGTDASGSRVSSGVYYASLRDSSGDSVVRLTLIK